jgi:hypothetical protein
MNMAIGAIPHFNRKGAIVANEHAINYNLKSLRKIGQNRRRDVQIIAIDILGHKDRRGSQCSSSRNQRLPSAITIYIVQTEVEFHICSTV